MAPDRGCREAAFALCSWLLLLPAAAQKGIGSLNDPCDCMQHHDYWMVTRHQTWKILGDPDFSATLFEKGSKVHELVRRQSCMYSPENEEAHRPTALSDCIPGFLFVHVLCMQRQLVDRRPDRAMAYGAELVRLYPFGMWCLDDSTERGWPITTDMLLRYYRRVTRAFIAGEKAWPNLSEWPEALLREMAWQPEGAKELPDDVSAIAKSIYEEAEVCPAATLPHASACWTIGAVGVSCNAACHGLGMGFRRPLSEYLGGEPVMPRLLLLYGVVIENLAMQQAWAPFECFVPGEHRFHLQNTEALMESDGEWSYPLCALACPCGPTVPSELQEVLTLMPPLPLDEWEGA
eukprot:gnl/TRDRNA2_/TRDRNA2_191406_c0_seq1.p1 gnl/TRDRNA2_/TRDRNA2_191406_c0~~gnl/TRDRNA2_/TRDRNA2_191406_c0_seq1.p1  ORF type:complete len:362 (-),score=51.23 gnl/TRDRNA2_/TRDRNA2_191406_c0_seq1:64-1107(-)